MSDREYTTIDEASEDDSDRVRSTFDRADNTARLALELAEAKREIARLRANYMLATDANRLNTRYASAREAVTRERKRAEIAEAEIARLHRDALAEAQAYRAMFARAQEAEARVQAVETVIAEFRPMSAKNADVRFGADAVLDALDATLAEADE